MIKQGLPWSALVWLLLLSACDRAPPGPVPQAGAAAQPGYVLSGVRYRLDLAGVERNSTGAPTLRTNRGYRVVLRRARVASFSAGLLPCAPASPARGQGGGASLLRQLFALPRAHAGHNSVRDPSYAQVERVEELTSPQRGAELGARSLPARRYCRVDYLVAASKAGDSLVLEGIAYAPDGRERTFAVHSQLAHSRRVELSSLIGPSASESGRLQLRFVRNLATLLDDLELRNASDTEIERGALRNLLAHLRIEASWD